MVGFAYLRLGLCMLFLERVMMVLAGGGDGVGDGDKVEEVWDKFVEEGGVEVVGEVDGWGGACSRGGSSSLGPTVGEGKTGNEIGHQLSGLG